MEDENNPNQQIAMEIAYNTKQIGYLSIAEIIEQLKGVHYARVCAVSDIDKPKEFNIRNPKITIRNNTMTVIIRGHEYIDKNSLIDAVIDALQKQKDK